MDTKNNDYINKPSDTKYLSENVYRLICVVGISGKSTSLRLLLNSDNVLSEEYVCGLLASRLNGDDERSIEECISALAPCFNAVDNYLFNLASEEFKDFYADFYEWTSAPEIFQRCFHLLQSTDAVLHDLAMLLCSSVLERSLGDIYLLKGKQCPSLLKDLLLTNELQNIFGDTWMRVLRTMIGPPSSLNLRNVYWHGFVVPGQIKKQYTYFILLMTATLGKKLAAKGVSVSSHRPFTTFPALTNLEIIEIDIRNSKMLELLIEETTFISNYMRPVWISAIRALNNNRSGDAIILLLTQLEHCLRSVFAKINNCEGRVLTAESAEFYTTFAEILNIDLPNGDNNHLHSALGISFLDMLYDLLVYPEGLRLRDQISHGEVNLNAISERMVSFVFATCVAFCSKWLPPSALSWKEPSVRQIYQWAENYETHFHPVTIAKYQITSISKELSSWLELPRPSKSDILFDIDWTLTDWSHHARLNSLCERTASISGSNLNDHSVPFQPFGKFDLPVTDLAILRSYHSSGKTIIDDDVHVHVATSHVDGLSSTAMINQANLILRQCTRVCNNVKSAVQMRFDQFKRRELRSRQRKTYARMLDSITFISIGLKLVMIHTFQIIKNASSGSYRTLPHERILRLAKHILKYSENIASHTNVEKNRWEEAVILTESLLEYLIVVMQNTSNS
ncbi:endoplasmic reticulum membrane-associated RNA degradation protein-like [Tubulanus polymorphus]|uniref:endoplasmic reticulum membrane-associated RNA degradation protein-like n=1 Tax=Tubulanus polymorphus TaxID=672921 RepID=UPI003DA50118